MDVIVKEYGTFVVAIVGALLGFSFLSLCVFTFKEESRFMIAHMTGVSYEDLAYVNNN